MRQDPNASLLLRYQVSSSMGFQLKVISLSLLVSILIAIKRLIFPKSQDEATADITFKMANFTLDINKISASITSISMSYLYLSLTSGVIPCDISTVAVAVLPVDCDKVTVKEGVTVAGDIELCIKKDGNTLYDKAIVLPNCDNYKYSYTTKCIVDTKFGSASFKGMYNTFSLYIASDLKEQEFILKATDFDYSDIKLHLFGVEKEEDIYYTTDENYVILPLTNKRKLIFNTDIVTSDESGELLSVSFINLNLFFKGTKQLDCSIEIIYTHLDDTVCSGSFISESALSSIVCTYSVAKCLKIDDASIYTKYYIVDDCDNLIEGHATGKCTTPAKLTEDFFTGSLGSIIINLGANCETLIHFTEVQALISLSIIQYPPVINFDSFEFKNIKVDGDALIKKVQEHYSIALNYVNVTLHFNQDVEWPLIGMTLALAKIYKDNPSIKVTISEQSFKTLITGLAYYSNYKFFDMEKYAEFNYNTLHVANNCEFYSDLLTQKCISPDAVSEENFTNFEAGQVAIQVHDSVEKGALDLGHLDNDPRIISISSSSFIGTSTKFAINTDGLVNLTGYTLIVTNLQLDWKTEFTSKELLPFTTRITMNNVVLTGAKEMFIIPEGAAYMFTKRNNYEFFGLVYPVEYNSLFVKETCGDAYEDDLHTKCDTAAEFLAETFEDFKQAGIIIFIEKNPAGEKLIKFDKMKTLTSFYIASTIASGEKPKIKIDLATISNVKSFSAGVLTLSFDFGSLTTPFTLPFDSMTLTEVTIAEDQCNKLKTKTGASIIVDTIPLYQCFGIPLPVVPKTSIAVLSACDESYDISPIKCLVPADVAAYDFADFNPKAPTQKKMKQVDTIPILIDTDLTKEQSFQFNKLTSKFNIVITSTEGVQRKFTLDVVNMGSNIDSLGISGVELSFNNKDNSEIVASSLSVTGCKIPFGQCSGIKLSESLKGNVYTDDQATTDCIVNNIEPTNPDAGEDGGGPPTPVLTGGAIAGIVIAVIVVVIAVVVIVLKVKNVF